MLVLLLACCFLFMTFYTGSNLEQRYHRKNADVVLNLESMPPWIAFSSVALGGFKSLLVNVLWIRIFDLQENDRYFELLQMSKWLTDLQPDMTNTWKFQVWNISYNVLARFTTPKERYRWIIQGIKLLRDKAIVYNPKNVELYTELGLLYELKMTLDHDLYHLSYKKLWAIEMTKLLGADAIDYSRYKSLPEDKDALVSKPQNVKLISLLAETDFNYPADFADLIFESKPVSERQLNIIRNYRESFLELSYFLRRERIQNEYKLDLQLMQDIENTFGGVDWHLPYAHGIYWGYKAVSIAGADINFAAERVLYQSAMLGVLNGTFVLGKDGSFYLAPNFSLIMPLKNHFLALGEKSGFEFVKAPFRFFLEDAVLMLYLKDDYAGALTLYEDLTGRYSDYQDDMESFVLKKLMKDSGTKSRKEFLVYLLRKYLWWHVIAGDDARFAAISDYANGYKKMAEKTAKIMNIDIALLSDDVLEIYTVEKYGKLFVSKIRKVNI